MKKIIIVLVVMLLGGCAPKFCDSSSPEYDPQRCQDYIARMQQSIRQTNYQIQQNYQQDQIDDLEMKQWRMRNTMNRAGLR